MAASTITGSVLYRPRVALPPGSIVRVRLEDVSREDIAPVSVAESETVTSGEQVPIPFALAVDTSALDPRARYAFHATIEVDGLISFTTKTFQPLPADVPAAGIEIVVQPIEPAATPTLV